MGWYGDDPRERGEAALEKCKSLEAKARAEDRPLTQTEQSEYNELFKEGQHCVQMLKKQRSDKAFMDALPDLGPLTDANGVPFPKSGAGPHDKSRRLSFKGMGRLAAGKMVDGVKALSPSGAALVSQEFKPDPVALGKPALSGLDIVPVIQHSTAELAYLRQVSRTNSAAEVAAGTVKPTSVYSVTRIENSLEVVAHLSEGIARHWLLDSASLTAFLESELTYGLQLAVEAKVMTDVNATSGVQSQSYSTSVLTTLRKGITKLETSGYTPSAFVLTPADWEGVELALSSTNSIEHQGLPYDPATRRLFGVPVTTSNSQAAGVGHILAMDAVALDTDNRGIDIQWSENATADSFSKNLVFARAEGRYATSVFSPLGVVTLDLTA